MTLLAKLRAWRTRRHHERHRQFLRASHVTFTTRDYSEARERALAQLGDNWLLAKPINRRMN